MNSYLIGTICINYRFNHFIGTAFRNDRDLTYSGNNYLIGNLDTTLPDWFHLT